MRIYTYILVFLLLTAVGYTQEGKNRMVDLPGNKKYQVKTDKSTVSRFRQPRKGPVIVFKTTIYDFGSVSPSQKVSCKFVFYNKGDAPLILKNVEAACGCTVPEWPKKPIMPGDSGVINAIFNPADYAGQVVNKSITVMTYIKDASGQDKVVTLFIKGSVKSN